MEAGDKIFLLDADGLPQTDELFYLTNVKLPPGNNIAKAQSADGGKSFYLQGGEFVILKGPSELEIDRAFDEWFIAKSKFRKDIQSAFGAGVEFCALYVNRNTPNPDQPL